MSENMIARPVAVSVLVLLLIGYGVVGLVRAVFNAFDGPSPVMWPLLAASMLTTIIISGLDILAGLMMLARRREGWMLAGVLLGAALIGGIVGSLQLWLMQVNDVPLYTLNPWRLYGNLLWIVAAVCLLFVLYSRSVRSWLDVQVVSIYRNLAGFLCLGLLLHLALLGIMILAGWLNSLMF